ncbi:MAG TPA: hypothetical protein VM912_23465, partial [Terriglobales bacterium]|nr:hypothetical protein [Terriglobales bacterium]
MRKLLFACAVLVSSFNLQAQRLPGGVVPEHYQLTFTPNLQDASFSGDEIIDVRVLKPMTTISLNAAEIKFVSASVESRGTT